MVGAVRDARLVPPPGRLDLRLGVRAPHPARALDALPRLQILVDLEEVLDLQAVELADMVDVPQMLQAGILGRHAQHLVVAALLVGHPEHADGTAADEAARERRLLDQYEGVERVAVLAQSALDEAVIG